MYVIKLEFSAGNLAATPFTLVKDPQGNTLTSGSGGWTFTRNGNNEITITHPLGVWVTNFVNFSQQSSGDFLTRPMHSVSTTNGTYVGQNTAKTTINIKGLTNTFSGILGSGTAYMYITFQLPTNDIYI